MASVEVRVGGALISGGLVKMEQNHETLWSEGTGRSASTGAMAGSIVARKRTFQLELGVLSQSQYDAVLAALNSADFMPVVVTVDGVSQSGTFYRSNVGGSLLGVHGGTAYYSGVNVQLIEV